MKLEDVTAAIRPRSDWEAVDLGFAMVRRSFWRCLTFWCLATGLPTLLAIWLLWNHPLLLLLLFWWWRPAGSRMVLFEISRRLFGATPTWREVWREIPRAWTQRFFHRFLILRLSPWLPVTLPIESLEGLRGAAYKRRAAQISRRGEGVTLWIYLMGDLLTVWLGIGLLFIILSFVPQGQDGAWQDAMQTLDLSQPRDIPLLILRSVVFCVMATMVLCDLFLTGAGFGIYINNRTWLEGWDVDLAFRRLNRRLTHGGLAMAIACAAAFATLAIGSPPIRAAETTPQERIERIKEDPVFEVHTVTDRVPQSNDWSWSSSRSSNSTDGSPIRFFFTLVLYFILAAVLALIIWAAWSNRHIFRRTGNGGIKIQKNTGARVVMGMEVTPESLPEDVPTAALALWEQGHRHQAMALLYRAAITALITQYQIEIEESDTEGDCLRRVASPGTRTPGETAGFFQSLTRIWSAHAYARQPPADGAIRELCANWPFTTERRSTRP